MGSVLVALASTLVACGPAEPPKPPPRVEAIFDVPREYRVFNALPCAEGAGLVYLLSADGDLHSFDPLERKFERIGELKCPAEAGARPNSMAVDRSGTAWVNYGDGSLWRASTTDGSCEPTEFQPYQHGFSRMGMAFATTGRDLMEETLFVWGGARARFQPGVKPPKPAGNHGPRPGKGLASIDREKLELLPVGDDRGPLSTRQAELSGTGEGKLYGFFSTRPATLAEIEPQTGSTLKAKALKKVRTGRAWAFAFWGGDFWFFWAPRGKSSNVSRLSGRTGKTETVLKDVGFTVVGAGVSTCAPTTAVTSED
ncbi:MAG: hypothetical protein JRI55_31905 [Deltaproteobacteria bacterium]|jgi:hypothetical protein|nr:hypothetical protein [Deltaproteobacteria bacterium]